MKKIEKENYTVEQLDAIEAKVKGLLDKMPEGSMRSVKFREEGNFGRYFMTLEFSAKEMDDNSGHPMWDLIQTLSKDGFEISSGYFHDNGHNSEGYLQRIFMYPGTEAQKAIYLHEVLDKIGMSIEDLLNADISQSEFHTMGDVLRLIDVSIEIKKRKAA